MDSARWQRIQDLFHEAAALPEVERPQFLKAACGPDEGLAAEVQALLDEDARGGSLLDRGVAQAAQQVLAGAAPLPAPRELGPYRIRRVLGEGGMGVVYLAEREDLGSVAAIKILRDAWMSPARRARFVTEQRTLAQLNHPSIARLYDADTLPDGTPWFAMEYVEGLPLTQYCEQRGCTIEARLELFRAVCEAVQHAHLHAVIHRDLKPSNILVRSDGSVRLLDFGIAKQLDRFDTPADQTRTGLRLMTPAYAAPEQIRGERVGIYTDVYALGVILYELLAGRLPFDLANRSPGEAEAMIAGSEPERPSMLGRRLHPRDRASWTDLDVLCLTAMHKDPQRRYRSVEALIRDIDHYRQGAPLEARPDTFGYRLGKFVRRNRRAVAATTAVVVLIAVLVVFFTVRLARARTAALAEAARTQRIQRFMQNLFQGGDKDAGPADDLRVVTLIDRGVQEARNLTGEPEVQAEMYQTLGDIYQKLGNLERAESLLSLALEQRRALFGPRHAKVAESLVAIGLLRADQAKLEEAERLVREGLDLSTRTLAADHPAVAAATDALGKVLEERGAYDRAVEVLEEAVRLRSASGQTTPELAASLYELANTHFYAGRYAESESLNQRALNIYRQIHGERHPLVSDVLINLGAIQFERGRYAEAEKFYRQALDITQSWYGKDHYRAASNLTMLGRSLVFQKRYDEAAGLVEQALAIQERVYGPVHPRVASTTNELGTIALQRGNLGEAEARYRRMAEIYRAIYRDGHYLIGTAVSNLGSVYTARKEYSGAERLFREAVGIYEKTLPAGHLNTGIARIKLGRTLVRQRRYPEAESHLLAGYEILTRQTSPSVSWLRAAREDLVATYEALRQPERAAKYKSELAEAAKAEAKP
jgi:serine/threonine-protein kinase